MAKSSIYNVRTRTLCRRHKDKLMSLFWTSETTARNWKILESYMRGETLEDIAIDHTLTKQRIHAIVKRSLNRVV